MKLHKCPYKLLIAYRCLPPFFFIDYYNYGFPPVVGELR